MIFFFDIDGTLMPFGKDIPASAAEAIHRLRADGHKAFLATGRSPSEVSSKVRSIGFDGAVYSSGAAVEIDGKFVFHRVWTKEEYGMALAYFASRGFPLILQSDSGTYLTEKTKDYWYSLLLEHVGRIVQVPGLQIIDGYPEEIELNKMLYIGGPLELVRSGLAPHLQVVANTVGLAPDMMGEVMLPGITKATGIDEALRALGMDLSESVAIGDGANDVEMVEHAGLGIAMGNSSPDLLAVADYVTDDVEADGLAKAIAYALSRSSRSRT